MPDLGFWNLAQADPEAIAVIDPQGRSVTRGELLAASNRIVHGLRELGLQPGDGIATLLPNSVEMLELYFAAMQAGWYLTPINFHLTAPEVAYVLGDCEAKAFFGHERFDATCRDAAEEVGLAKEGRLAIGGVENFLAYEDLQRGQSDALPADRLAGSPMHYTSGTTGRPKGVRRGLSGLDPDTGGVMFTFLLQMFGVAPEDDNVHCTGSPLYHTAVLTFTAASLNLGHAVALMDKWTAAGMLDVIAQHRVTTSHMVPTQFKRFLDLPEETRAQADISSLRCMIHAAAPCPVDVKQAMLEWWGPVIYEYYAATEGGGTIVTPQEWLERPGTVGKAWTGATIKIVDDDGKECPAGTPGTVYMGTAAGDFEYFKDKEKTKEGRRDGMFTVGDIGYLDEGGYLFLCDRKSDMIIAGGVNIYPAEIESVIITHAKVADVAVFGIPNDDLGEEVKAVIEVAEGVTAGPEFTDEIIAFCATRLAKYKMPRSFDYIDEMPRDPNGKLYKRKLRDPYWEGRDRAI